MGFDAIAVVPSMAVIAMVRRGRAGAVVVGVAAVVQAACVVVGVVSWWAFVGAVSGGGGAVFDRRLLESDEQVSWDRRRRDGS